MHEKSEESKPNSLGRSLAASPDQEWGRVGSHCTLHADLGRHADAGNHRAKHGRSTWFKWACRRQWVLAEPPQVWTRTLWVL